MEQYSDVEESQDIDHSSQDTIDLSEDEKPEQSASSRDDPIASTSAAAAAPPAKRSRKGSSDPYFTIDAQPVQFHLQNPNQFRNNCSYSILLTYLQLLAFSSFEPQLFTFQPSDPRSLAAFETLKKIYAYFTRQKRVLSRGYDAAAWSSSALTMYFRFVEGLDPRWGPKPGPNNTLDCLSNFSEAVLWPLSPLSKLLLRRLCSCAMALRDDYNTVPWKSWKEIVLRFFFQKTFKASN
jgi:hypothetical protein